MSIKKMLGKNPEKERGKKLKRKIALRLGKFLSALRGLTPPFGGAGPEFALLTSPNLPGGWLHAPALWRGGNFPNGAKIAKNK